MINKKLIIAAIAALVVGTGIGTTIPVIANPNKIITSVEQAQAIIDGKAIVQEPEKENEEIEVEQASENDDSVSVEETIVDENEADNILEDSTPAFEMADGAIFFDWDVTNATILGLPIDENIIDSLCEKYGFIKDMEHASKDFEDGLEISYGSNVNTYDDYDGTTIESKNYYFDIKPVGSYDYQIDVWYVEKTPWAEAYVQVAAYSQDNQYVDEVKVLADKYTTGLPLLVENEEELEENLHVNEILSKYDFNEVSGIPFDSNYPGTSISEYKSTMDNGEVMHSYSIKNDLFEVTACNNGDETMLYKIICNIFI